MTEREALADIVRTIGVLTYGKERWFKQNGCWYDRANGDYIQNETLAERVCDELYSEIEAEQTEPKVIPTQESDWKEAIEKIAELLAEQTEPKYDKDINVRSKTEPQTDCSWK